MSEDKRARSTWNAEGLEGCGCSVDSPLTGRKRWRSEEKRARSAFTEE
jgi:hypothetical protein